MKHYFFIFFLLSAYTALGMQPINVNKDLLEAAASGNHQKVEEALNKGADINTQSILGNTPLHAALYSGTPELVNILLERGANSFIKNKEDKTPLDTARASNKIDIATLLDFYPKVTQEALTQPSEDTLLKAVTFGWSRIVRYLFESSRLALPVDHIEQYMQLAQINYQKTENPAYKHIEQTLKQWKRQLAGTTYLSGAAALESTSKKVNQYWNKVRASIKPNN
jgi:ankyrin repeat protein